MGEVYLPQEVMCQIFLNLNGRSVHRCRAVSRYWKDAVDSLSHIHWKKICKNDPYYLDYATIHKKSGLPWRDTFRALHSWMNINPGNMKTSLLCQGVKEFRVLPIGLIACIVINKVSGHERLSDTIIYFDAETSQLVNEKHFNFSFLPSFYDENEHLQVFVALEIKQGYRTRLLAEELHISLIVKKTGIRYYVDAYNLPISMPIPKHKRLQATIIGKKFYFRKSKPISQIYCSEMTKIDGIETKWIGNIEFEDEAIMHGRLYIKQFTEKDGDLYIHCVGKKDQFIFKYQNYAFVCIYKALDVFKELSFRTMQYDFGFHWLKDKYFYQNDQITDKFDFPLYSNGIVVLTHLRKRHRFIFTVYNVINVSTYEELLSVLEDEQDVLCTFSFDKIESNQWLKSIKINYIDLVETSSSNKILISMYSPVTTEHNLIVYEFPHGGAVSKRMNSKVSETKSNERYNRACTIS